MNQLTRNIHDRRKKLRFTESQLVRAAGITTVDMKTLKKSTVPDAITLARIAKALQCQVEDLLGEIPPTTADIWQLCAARIKTALFDLDMPTVELAKKIGASQTLTSQIVNATRLPSMDKVLKIEKALGVSLQEYKDSINTIDSKKK